MNRLRNRLILIFLAATLAPLAATVWLTTSLLRRSVEFSSTGELDVISQSLQRTGSEYQQRMKEELVRRAAADEPKPQKYAAAGGTSVSQLPKLQAAGSASASQLQKPQAAGGTSASQLPKLQTAGSASADQRPKSPAIPSTGASQGGRPQAADNAAAPPHQPENPPAAGAHAAAPPPQKYRPADAASWPAPVQTFAAGEAPSEFLLAGEGGSRLDYLVRHGNEVWVYSEDLGIGFDSLSKQIRDAHDAVEWANGHDLRRGLPLVYVLFATVLWLASLALLVYLAHRISRPIQQLTAGLAQLARGDLSARVPKTGDDEVGRAIHAFNHMAGKLQESTERLVYLRQLASWQRLAQKMAHEVKNSLTPIRLTVEEMVARHSESDRAFIEQASEIVVEEIESLERRVRAFSQFAAEPPVCLHELDVNSLIEERIAFLKTAHPEVAYDTRLADGAPSVIADQDLVKGILTNLLENAAEAAGEGGRILGVTAAENGRIAIEVHDSGPGLSREASASLFQPTISFKKKGMGLGLSIARKSALLSGGDIVPVKGELGGAAFRVLLPAATHAIQARPDRG